MNTEKSIKILNRWLFQFTFFFLPTKKSLQNTTHA